jgi:hypothetical protein
MFVGGWMRGFSAEDIFLGGSSKEKDGELVG